MGGACGWGGGLWATHSVVVSQPCGLFIQPSLNSIYSAIQPLTLFVPEGANSPHSVAAAACAVQIDRLVSRAFRNLKADEVLNFSVAVTVMRVQRKWRARMRAAKLKRKREVRLTLVHAGHAQ